MKSYLLSQNEKEFHQRELNSWEFTGKTINKTFLFKDFIEAFSYITKMALYCEKVNHHPSIQNTYNKVIIKLTTHDLNGISNLDINLAKKIDELFNDKAT